MAHGLGRGQASIPGLHRVIVILSFSAMWLALLILAARAVAKAPLGYEDEAGYHSVNK